MGSLRFPGDPSCAYAPLQDPGRIDAPSPWRSRRCCPCSLRKQRLQRNDNIEAYDGALAPAVYASRAMLPPPMQDSLPAGWPLPGGRRTLWIAMKGFRFYISSPFPGFILTRRRLVLDGSEHSRTMIESGGQTAARSQAARAKPPAASWSSEKRKHDLSAHRTQTDAATIATRRPRPAPRGSVARAASGPRDRAWPDRREGAAQILRIRLCKTCTLD